MLAVQSKPQTEKKGNKLQNIITVKYEKITEVKENGDIVTRFVPKKTDVTRMVNETKKLIKQENALDKINELKEILEKESNNK